MNKDQLLQELSAKITTGEITYDEMMNRFNLAAVKTQVPTAPVKPKEHFSVTQILYVLGAVIVIIGLILFTYQIWDDIGSVGRITVTLGLGVLLTAIGSLLLKQTSETLTTVFQFLGGFLIPGGALVTVSELGNAQSLSWPRALAFGVIFVFYFLLNRSHKNALLTFFTVANGTAFLYFLTYALTHGSFDNYVNIYTYLTLVIGACYILLAYSFRSTWNEKLTTLFYFCGFVGIQIAVGTQYFDRLDPNSSPWFVVFSFALIFAFYYYLNTKLRNPVLTLLTIINGTGFVYVFVGALVGGSFYMHESIYTYLTMIIGASYLFLSYSFKEGWNNRLCEILNFFGVLGVLGASFSKIFDSTPWRLFFFVIVVAGFVTSVYVKSRSILVLSTVFLIAYVSYITSKYFADSIGWPVSLVILGFIFIALGYMSIAINKKYIKG